MRESKLLSLISEDIKNKFIMDVGCSTGYLGQKLEKLGAKVTGIDISQKAIKEAQKVLTNTKVVDLNNSGRTPFKDNTFDIVIASEIIEHLFQPANTLKEFYRVLKSDGQLILSTPNFLYWGNRLKFLIGQFKYTQSGMFDEGHIHFYTYQSLREDLADAGFEIDKENHVFAGGNLLNFIRSKFPALFAYQFVLKCQKLT